MSQFLDSTLVAERYRLVWNIVFHTGTMNHCPSSRSQELRLEIVYRIENQLGAQEFVDVLRRSTLSQRRPVDEPETITGMLRHADLIVTARVDSILVGVARAITDFSYCTYLSDLAVDVDHQRKGIGKELIRRVHEAAGPGTTLILLAAPAAETYYPHLGMIKHHSCWTLRKDDQN